MSASAMVRKFLEMPNDSRQKTILVAVLLCLVCSIAVSTAAVALRPLQERNQQLDIQRNILQIGGLYQSGVPINEQFEAIEARVVNLDTGEYVPDIDPLTFNARSAANNPAMNTVLERSEDIASIRRRANYATVYMVRDEQGELERLILPVHGYGLWSTLYGFLALESDLNTIIGFGFYEHAETPGLGGEVDNPRWRAQFQGKQVFDQSGNVAIRVMKSPATEGELARHQVDGLSGATLTADGVDNMLRFWLGSKGFGSYLQGMRSGEGV